ncbi:unnamed protein product [Pleuronectes platessa]|uniref:Uncharacterized protein n=1 Tax=Pleuronectes platessa TaxID=8262 RepID=A0A9N7USA7_PLEPL|nr:unnamed protein product [Pleuronectes platessa]
MSPRACGREQCGDTPAVFTNHKMTFGVLRGHSHLIQRARVQRRARRPKTDRLLQNGWMQRWEGGGGEGGEVNEIPMRCQGVLAVLLWDGGQPRLCQYAAPPAVLAPAKSAQDAGGGRRRATGRKVRRREVEERKKTYERTGGKNKGRQNAPASITGQTHAASAASDVRAAAEKGNNPRHGPHVSTYLPLRGSLPLGSAIKSKAPKPACYGDPCLSAQFRGALVISVQPLRATHRSRDAALVFGWKRDTVWATSARAGRPHGLFHISGEGLAEEIDSGRAQ